MDAAAREELQRLLAYIVSRRTREKPQAVDGFGPLADNLVRSWADDCAAAGYELVTSRYATWLLTGVFVRELRLTDIVPNPGYETQVIAEFGSYRLCADVPVVDPSLN
jgi:hypothetical protein